MKNKRDYKLYLVVELIYEHIL